MQSRFSASCWFLALLILRSCRQSRSVCPKRQSSFTGLHGVIFQNIALFNIVYHYYVPIFTHTNKGEDKARIFPTWSHHSISLGPILIGVRSPSGLFPSGFQEEKKIFTSFAQRPNRVWNSPNILYTGHQGDGGISQEVNGRGMKFITFITHLHLVA
jgi:hypothetical protein